MDPQQRLLLHASHLALEDAGYVPDATPGWQRERMGVWVGAATWDYVQNLRGEVDVYYSTGRSIIFMGEQRRTLIGCWLYRDASCLPERPDIIRDAAERAERRGRHRVLLVERRALPRSPRAHEWRL
jgi:hypothetical protein